MLRQCSRFRQSTRVRRGQYASVLIDMLGPDTGTAPEQAHEIGQFGYCCVDARCDTPCELPFQLEADHLLSQIRVM
jgi:hypothetical protein